MVKTILIVNYDVRTVEIINAVFVLGRFCWCGNVCSVWQYTSQSAVNWFTADCDVSCMGTRKTLTFVPIKNVHLVGITNGVGLYKTCMKWTTLKRCL